MKEVLVGHDTIRLRHSIPVPQSGPGGPGSNGSMAPTSGPFVAVPKPDYLLRTGSTFTAAFQRVLTLHTGLVV